MDLRTKLLLGIGIALICAFSLVALFSAISMEASYKKLETIEMEDAVATAWNAIETDLKSGFSTARDYSVWSSTYQFVEGENPDWLRENMLPYYPLGVYKDVVADGYANAAEAALARAAECPIAQQKRED